MGTTTISLRDEAYDQLRAAKREGESFSDVVLRLTDSPTTDEQIATLAGELDADFADAVTASSEQVGASLEMESGETE